MLNVEMEVAAREHYSQGVGDDSNVKLDKIMK